MKWIKLTDRMPTEHEMISEPILFSSDDKLCFIIDAHIDIDYNRNEKRFTYNFSKKCKGDDDANRDPCGLVISHWVILHPPVIKPFFCCEKCEQESKGIFIGAAVLEYCKNPKCANFKG